MVEQNFSGYNNAFKFNGKEQDPETGYYYYGARYYDPKMSLFVSVDPLAEQFVGWSPYNYTMNNPLNMTDPSGMAPEPPDWIYNKKDDTYHWDSTVSSSRDIQDNNYEYVGPSTNDVQKHHKDNNPIMSNFTAPSIGNDLNAAWPGEFMQRDVTIKDRWAASEGIVGKITYGVVNDTWITLQSINPFQDRENITSFAGYGVNQSERVDAGVNTVSSLMPLGKLTKGAPPLLNTMNASKFSSKFKGTVLTQTSAARRGMYNRNINRGIRALNSRYGSFRESVKSNTETFAPIFRDDMKQKRK